MGKLPNFCMSRNPSMLVGSMFGWDCLGADPDTYIQ